MSVTLTPSFFAAALNAPARLVVSSMPLMPCCVNLMVVMKVAIDNLLCEKGPCALNSSWPGRIRSAWTLGSLLITDNWSAVAAEVNDFGRLGIFGWFQAQVQKNILPTELAFKGEFGRMDVLASADGN